MKRLLVVGSANVDLVATTDMLPQRGQTILGGDFSSHLGGKGANQAVAAARAGGNVAMIARVGNDPFGERLLSGLRDEGIDISGTVSMPGPSGVALIITAKNDNMIVVAPGANAGLTAAQLEGSAFEGVAGVLVQLETPIDGVLQAAEFAARNGAWFMLDPAPARPLPGDLLAKVDWITPNESEARILLDLGEARLDGFEAARRLRQAGARGVVIKLGERGVVISVGNGDPVAVPAISVETRDTTAAGDAFNGAFATALAEGLNPVEAARFGVAAAAIAVTRLGAQSSIAYRKEINDLLSKEAKSA